MGAVKCVLVGDAGSGKSCLIHTYINKSFPENPPGVYFEPHWAVVTIGGDEHKLSVFDTNGLAEYYRLRPLIYPKTDVLLVCFSVTSPSAFNNVKEMWVPEITLHCPNTPFLIIGTQVDMRNDAKVVAKLQNNNQSPITFETGKNMAQELGAVQYTECSALTMEGVDNVFTEAVIAARNSPQRHNRRCCTVL